MYQLTKDMKFGNHVKTNTHKLIDDNQYTPGGMVYFQQWGTARHAANSAFWPFYILFVIPVKVVHSILLFDSLE